MVPIPTIKRFPSYLRLLYHYQEEGHQWISATTLAKELSFTAVQVRKDVSATGVEGKPKIGFEIAPLIDAIRHTLGWDCQTEAILIGAGNLGSAFARYEGFSSYGFRIVAVFDNDPAKEGLLLGSLQVQPVTGIASYIAQSGVDFALLAIPASVVQQVAEELVQLGIKAFWNFAPRNLKLPASVLVQRTDLSTSFAVLSARYTAQKAR